MKGEGAVLDINTPKQFTQLVDKGVGGGDVSVFLIYFFCHDGFYLFDDFGKLLFYATKVFIWF